MLQSSSSSFYTLSLHDALPIFVSVGQVANGVDRRDVAVHRIDALERDQLGSIGIVRREQFFQMLKVVVAEHALLATRIAEDRKSTRLNSSHANISYAVFCLKKK